MAKRYTLTYETTGKKPDQMGPDNASDNEDDMKSDNKHDWRHALALTYNQSTGRTTVRLIGQGRSYNFYDPNSWNAATQQRNYIFEYHQLFLTAMAGVQSDLCIASEHHHLLVNRYERGNSGSQRDAVYKISVLGNLSLDVIVVSVSGDNCVLERVENASGTAIGGSFHRIISIDNFCEFLEKDFLLGRPVAESF